LHKIEERLAALRQAHRLLKPGGLIFASFITRYAGFRDAAVHGYSFVLDDPPYSRKLLVTGVHDNGIGFADAYYVHPDEVLPLAENAGFTTLRLMGCEGILAGHEEYVNSLTGADHAFWLEINYHMALEPSLLGASDHLLYIGRKDNKGLNVAIEGPLLNQASICIPLLRLLPDWFGLETSILNYQQEIEHLPTFLAKIDDRVVGFLSLKQHTTCSAEILVMAVHSDVQRGGVGRALVKAAETYAHSLGVEYMQVKTLGSSNPDPGYAKTRAFYDALDYCPLEELKQIWDESNPCLILVKRL